MASSLSNPALLSKSMILPLCFPALSAHRKDLTEALNLVKSSLRLTSNSVSDLDSSDWNNCQSLEVRDEGNRGEGRFCRLSDFFANLEIVS